MEDLFSKLGSKFYDRPNPYPLGWVNKDADIKVMKQCANCIDEMEVDVVPLDVCGVVLGIPYMYMRDAILTRRENQYHLIKDGSYFIINAHIGKYKIFLVSANQANKLIIFSRKFVLLFLRENQPDDELIKVKSFMEGCTKEKKHQLEEMLQAYREVFQEPKGLQHKRQVEHDI
jgi:hypothetical protein